MLEKGNESKILKTIIVNTFKNDICMSNFLLIHKMMNKLKINFYQPCSKMFILQFRLKV